MLKMTSKSFQT